MKSAKWPFGFAVALLALSNGCGGNSQSDPSSDGSDTGSVPGAASGGDGTGATASGGSEVGGAITGTGGVAIGGRNTGGGATGGDTAGASTGGGNGGVLDGTGGALGGNDTGTGGAETGGASDGGGGAGATPVDTGGNDTGTGGASDGGGGVGGANGEALLELDQTRMDFGTIILGATAHDTFTLTNRGASTSGIPSITVESILSPDPVTVSGCDSALPSGESCSLDVSVTPPELGLFDAFVRITAEPGTQPYLSIYVVGRASGFEVLPPSILELGNVPPGVPIQHSITVTAVTAISDLTVWTVGDDVTIDASTSTCTETLAAATSCVIAVQFLAPDVGWKDEMIGIRAGGDFGDMATVAITANVTSANDLAVEPKSPPPFVAYYEETTEPIVFTVTNVGETSSGTITAAVVGEWGSDYAISDTDCTSLAPQGTCTVSVVCSPPMSAAGGPRDAVLSITDGNTHVAIPLTATVSFRD